MGTILAIIGGYQVAKWVFRLIGRIVWPQDYKKQVDYEHLGQ